MQVFILFYYLQKKQYYIKYILNYISNWYLQIQRSPSKSTQSSVIGNMEVTFKNSFKNQQCHEFISIFKKMKFFLSSKDRRVYFHINKDQIKISTFGSRRLDDPPANSPHSIIEYNLKSDFFSFSGQPGMSYMFAFNIDDMVKAISHYVQTKMVVMKLIVDNRIQQGHIEISLADSEMQGYIKLTIQQIQSFPTEQDLKKSYIQKLKVFQIDQDNEKIKQLQDLAENFWYQIHQNGIYIKNYEQGIEVNHILLERCYLKSYDPQALKKQLRMNIFLFEENNYMISEMKRCAKRKFKKTIVNLIIVKNPTKPTQIRHTYFEIKSYLSNYQKSSKTVFAKCNIAETVVQGQLVYKIPEPAPNFLKTEDNGTEIIRRAVLNKWADPKFQQLVKADFRNPQKFCIDADFDQPRMRKFKYNLDD